MIGEEVANIVESHIYTLGAIINKMDKKNENKAYIILTKQELLEIRATCLYAYYKLTGIDLQDEPFTKEV